MNTGGSEPRTPVLLLLKGHPGTGKTTLSRKLARQLKWALIDKDDIKDCLTAGAPIAPDCNTLSYDVAWRIVETQLSCGTSTVFDSPLARKEIYERASNIAAKCGARTVVVEVQLASSVLWRQRLETRGVKEPSQHKPHTWDALQALISSYKGCDRWLVNSKESITSISVDTSTNSSEECVKLVLRHLMRLGLLPEQADCIEDSVFLLSG